MVKAREKPLLKARVTVSCEVGHKGPFFKAKAEPDIGIITVSLEADVWQEERRPQGGEHVVLEDVTMKKGWRANKARFFRPGDEELFREKS